MLMISNKEKNQLDEPINFPEIYLPGVVKESTERSVLVFSL